MGRIVLSALGTALAVAFLFGLAPVVPARAQAAAAGEGTAPVLRPGVQTLSAIRLGTLPEYTRLIFTFTKPVREYQVRRVEVNELRLDFGPSQIRRQGRLEMNNDVVQGVVTAYENDRLTARVKLSLMRFTFRHFLTADRQSVVLDLKPDIEAGAADREEKPKGPKLALPSPKTLAKELRRRLPATPKPDTDLALLATAADAMSQGDYQAAVDSLEAFKTSFPGSPHLEKVLYMLGEAYYLLDPNDPSTNFIKIAAAYQTALDEFPSSPQGPRARLILGRTYKAMDYPSEAAEQFKKVNPKAPDSIEALMGQVELAEVYLKLGKRRLAEDVLEQVLAKNPQGNFVLKSYTRLGEMYFRDGLYSRANEIFREILNQNDTYYVHQPDILYFMGEGYYHLKRTDLAREFLYHHLNMEPDSPMADLILARIGDTYQDEGRTGDAIRIYALVRRRYPGTPGSAIAQMRLARSGALRTIFRPDSIFLELEDGTHEATLKMYQEVVDTMKDSPLAQFAMFKIGLAYFGQEEHALAIRVFTDILDKYPKGSLTDDVLEVLNKSLIAEAESFLAQKKYVELIALYNQNKEYVTDDSWPTMRHYLAQAYAGLNMFQEAVAHLEANKGLTDLEDERLLALGRAYHQLGRYDEAAKTFAFFLESFPDHEKTPQALVDLAMAEQAAGRKKEAIEHLSRAIAKSPDLDKDGRIQGLLGQLYLQEGRFEEAVTAMKKSLDALENRELGKVDVFLTYSNLAQAYLRLGRKPEALEALETAMEFLPETPFPETLYLIADAYRQLGRDDDYRSLLDMIEKSSDPFWRGVAEQKIRDLETEKKASQLLKNSSSKKTVPGYAP